MLLMQSMSVTLVLGVMAGIAIWLLRRAAFLRQSQNRLNETDDVDSGLNEQVPEVSESAIRRFRLWTVASGCCVALILLFIVGLTWVYAVAFGLLAGLIAWQVEGSYVAWQTRRLEQQLADAIDMMIAAVRSGSSLPGALESALAILKPPLREEFDLLVGRVRLGDSPLEALGEMAERIPLETYRLFTQTLSVNWMIGGRLSQTLANVAKTIRDRIELTRRLHAMTTQARLSVISVIVVTYFIAALMWRNDPDRMSGFLKSSIGQGVVAIALTLQGVGILWISRLSQPRF